MGRPPLISLLLFALPIGFILYGSVVPRVGDKDRGIGLNFSTNSNDRIAVFADGWPKEPDFRVSFNALDPSIDVGNIAPSIFDPSDDYFGLPRDEGYELIYGLCGACHSLRIVMQQHATKERWIELLDWMENEQNMPPLQHEDNLIVVKYLTRNFGAT